MQGRDKLYSIAGGFLFAALFGAFVYDSAHPIRYRIEDIDDDGIMDSVTVHAIVPDHVYYGVKSRNGEIKYVDDIHYPLKPSSPKP